MAASRLPACIATAMLMAAMPGVASGQTSQSLAVPPPIAPVDPNDKVRCRKITVTGSLVKSEKTCKTVGEWRRLADRGNDVARDQWQNGLICSGGECRGLEP